MTEEKKKERANGYSTAEVPIRVKELAEAIVRSKKGLPKQPPIRYLDGCY